MMNRYIYVHYRLDDGTPFYVGKGVGYRAYNRNGRNSLWRSVVESVGYRVELLVTGLTEEQALSQEIAMIALYRSLGYRLVNLTEGGDGGGGRSLSEETKARISLSMKHKYAERGFSDEHKVKLSLAKKGRRIRPRSAEHQMKLNSRIRKPVSDETRKKLSLSRKGRPLSAETKTKLSALNKGKRRC